MKTLAKIVILTVWSFTRKFLEAKHSKALYGEYTHYIEDYRRTGDAEFLDLGIRSMKTSIKAIRLGM